MTSGAALTKNLEFWHWYPELLVRDLTPEQLRWQPPEHDTSITFAIWHSYRAADEILHGMVFGAPSVFASQGWGERLPAEKMGVTPFGNGATREQIGALSLDMDALVEYARAVGVSISEKSAAMSAEEAAQEVPLPFFKDVYPMLTSMTKAEMVAFFAIGHTSEHLGEVQMIKGLLGLKGAPL